TSRNTAIDFIKKIAADKELQKEICNRQLHIIGEDDYQLMTKEYHRLYLQAIEALSPQRRNVFLLCREEGKTYEEAAHILGISRDTVKEHMAKSLRFLREFLADRTELTLLLVIAFDLF